MFERLKTPEEAFSFQLGTALKMEHTVLSMLEDLMHASQDEKLVELFRAHHAETHQQLSNIERTFQAFGWDPDESSSPVIQALEKEGKSNIKKSDKSFSDTIVLQSANETEHHEIAVYENLIVSARAMGNEAATRLLDENLQQERRMLERVQQTLRLVAAAAPGQTA